MAGDDRGLCDGQGSHDDPAHDHTQLLGGRYRLGELLGVGGSASVFAADDLSADSADSSTGAGITRRVAVKILHPELWADDKARRAFLREAKRASRIDHPNVVRVHGAGLHDAAGILMPWISLDLLSGPTLKELVEDSGPLTAADAAAVLDGVLAGLAAAHAAGLVHRDLNPQNIVLEGIKDRQGGSLITALHVRIVDFGLADSTGHTTLGDDILLSGGESQTRTVGNPQFMSPEQAQGLPVRSVSDLYQAGAVLYYALTGAAPFPRATSEETLRAHVVAPPPPPSALVHEVRALDRVVTRAMAKTPARRYRDAAEFREALRSAIATPVALICPDPLLGRTIAVSHNPGTALTQVVQPDSRPAVGSLGYLEAPEHSRAEPGRTAMPAASAGGGLLVVGVLATIIVAGVLAATAGTHPAPTPPAAIVASTPTPTPQATQTTPAAQTTQTPPVTRAPTTPASSAPILAPSASPIAEPPTSEPVTVSAPTLYGTLTQAEAALHSAGLILGTVTRIESGEAADRVLAQHPAAGQAVRAGGAVDLTVASGFNVVPETKAMTVATATALLESFGFAAAPVPLDAGRARTVSSSQPAAGAVLRVGISVMLLLEPVQPEASATPKPPEGQAVR